MDLFLGLFYISLYRQSPCVSIFLDRLLFYGEDRVICSPSPSAAAGAKAMQGALI